MESGDKAGRYFALVPWQGGDAIIWWNSIDKALRYRSAFCSPDGLLWFDKLYDIDCQLVYEG